MLPKLLLLSYLLIPVYMPALGAIDPAATRWLALAALNLVVFLVWQARQGRGEAPPLPGFMRTIPGLLWGLLLGVSLLSFTAAVNLPEALITFTRMGSAFAAAWLISILFRSGKEMLPFLALVLTVLVIFESLVVIGGVIGFIRRSASSIYEIQFTYTNKNILAAAIFIKLSGPLWLLFFTRGWRRNLAAAALFAGSLSLFFLSARAFYIGLALTAVILALYAGIRYRRAGEKRPFRSLLRFMALVVLAFGVFTPVQRYLYPKDRDTWNYNKSVVARVAEIRTEVKKSNQPAGIRLSSWQRTLRLIRDNPWLGVGAGNWKVAVLQYENQERSDFAYMLHNHNDFAQVTAATGLPGGILFLLLVAAIPVAFLLAARHPVPGHALQQSLFLPALGILAFAVDVFFNYPLARPEIMGLFAVFAGILSFRGLEVLRFGGIFSNRVTEESRRTTQEVCLKAAESGVDTSEMDQQATTSQNNITKYLRVPSCLLRVLRATPLTALLGLILLIAGLNFTSHRIEKQLPSAPWRCMSLPSFPNLTSKGEPVAVVKAKYLIGQERFPEAIAILYPDRSSPFDSRREYYLSKAYAGLNQPDKAAYWLAMARKLKPTAGY